MTAVQVVCNKPAGQGGASSGRRPFQMSRAPLNQPRYSANTAWSRGTHFANQATSIIHTSTGGGSGGAGSHSRDGGGDGDDDGRPAVDKSVFGWKGWQERVAADPLFAYKMAIEQIIGVTCMVAGDVLSRPNFGLDELDFVFATLVVGCIINFAAVYLLAPVATSGGSAARARFMQKLFGTQFLEGWGAPPSHMFQPGFGPVKRVVNYAYKGAVFSTIGLGAGLLGTALSNGLLAARMKMDPNLKPTNEPPSIMGNASCWALQMALSANTRYQIVNGLDMVMQPRLSTGAFRLYASALRAANNLLGGMSFVALAKVLGVQKAADT